MIRTLLIVLAVVAAAVLIIALRGEPGAAELTWFHWNVRTTAAAAAMLMIFFTLAASLFWRGLIWVAEAPRRAAKARADVRRRQGQEALTRGFLAAAAGDGAEARRQAQRAAGLVDETPALVRLLSAQAAEAAGDAAGARAAYAAMLGFPELRMAAHRGLMQAALAEGDAAEAQRHAEAAYGLARTAPWAWQAVLEAKLAAGDWPAALALMQGALERKIISPIVAERARAALLTAYAAAREGDVDERVRAAALDDAQTAARLAPGFAPAAVVAARLLADDGRAARAAQMIEAAWKVAAHPALWLAYRDLRTDETPRERAGRLASLAAFNPEAREARILMAEQALIAGDGVGARAAAKSLQDEPLTRRLAGLQARIASALGDRDEARAWTARGAEAPQEPDWSDLDPEGRAFAYTAADWARIAQAYAERGELTHPRFERRERGVSDLPELPAAYVESAPFISAAESGQPALPIVDDSDFGLDLDPADADADPAPPSRPRRVFGGGRGKAR
ncbi:MAG TPA: heme biosynthesis HemY N-terminal domain-containing protein [Caulobacteraceae bacterium]|nr:heme biosynthesis HemY N-terminal domain-containing protein [Caulobacteraceae bacterium]